MIKENALLKRLFFLLFCSVFLIVFACSPESTPTISNQTEVLSTEYTEVTETLEISEETLEISPETDALITEIVTETPAESVVETPESIESPLQTETVDSEETIEETAEETTPTPEYAGTIALTFDDGPGKYTERLLNIFKENGGKATFFVVGNRASYQKNILKRMTDEGHEVGNHTYSHLSLKEIEYDEAVDQISRAKTIIESATGVDNKLVRAPYGDLNADVKEIARELNVSLIHWSLDSFDWMTRDAQLVYDELMSRVKDGDIILLHDIHESTVEAMEMVIPELVNKGYKLVTVSELLTETRDSLSPGAVYSKK